MEYISPIGEIGFVDNTRYKGDLSYKHTGLFPTAIAQKTYFDNFSKKYSNYQYNKDRNVFVIGDNIANLSKYSYMWFNNASSPNGVFENKRYYAFITNMRLVNNTTTEVQFTIDIIQTFLFDIDVPPCLVEREHTLTDNMYEHIIAEDMNVSDTVVAHETEITFPRMLCGIILNKRLSTYHHGDRQLEFKESFLPPFFNVEGVGADVGDIPNTLYWYAGFPITDEDVEYYRSVENTENGYNTQYLYSIWYDENNVKHYDTSLTRLYTASYALYNIVNGVYESTDGELSEDNIVAVYIYPDFSSKNSNIENAENNNYYKGLACNDYTIQRALSFISPNKTGVGYRPKNNKLYSYPYSQIECVNNQGQRATFKFENFNEKIKFRLTGNYTNPAMLILTPLNYDGDLFNYDNSVTISGFPEPFYSGNALNRYLQQNASKREATMTANVMNACVSTLAGVINKNPIPVISGVSQLLGTAIMQEAQIADLSNTPPQNYSIFNTDFINVGIKKIGFSIKQKTIRAENAKIVDDYFTMYGYKIKEIKQPNVFTYLYYAGTVNIRPSFNYIKTSNCLVKNYSTSRMCDATVLSNIATILNNGITFWSNIGEMGNYSLDNSPQSNNF